MGTRPAIFKWRQTEPGLILCAVRWYLRYSLSLRDVEELLEERDLNADHTTVQISTRRGFCGPQMSDLRQRGLVSFRKEQSALDLGFQDTVLRSQIFVPQQQFLIDSAGDVGQHASPVHSRASLKLIVEPGLYMLLRFQKAAVRGNYETGNQAFSKRLRFLTIREAQTRSCAWAKRMSRIWSHYASITADRRSKHGITFWQHLIRQHGLHGQVWFITVHIARIGRA